MAMHRPSPQAFGPAGLCTYAFSNKQTQKQYKYLDCTSYLDIEANPQALSFMQSGFILAIASKACEILGFRI
jgi:hypothetical protein